MNEIKSNDAIFAEALIRVIENQIEIKKHIGLVRDDSYYVDCYSDRQVIVQLNDID